MALEELLAVTLEELLVVALEELTEVMLEELSLCASVFSSSHVPVISFEHAKSVIEHARNKNFILLMIVLLSYNPFCLLFLLAGKVASSSGKLG